MIYTRIFQKNITLTNVQEIYQVDINTILMNKLKNDFENKCYKSSFILSINKIINRSDINFNNKDLNASANVSIMFEANILQYDKYDIINNVKITAITEQKIICQTKHASIFIQYEDRLSDYKDGQIISIRVGVCKYYLGENKISINAFPFVPLKDEIEEIYYNINSLTDDDVDNLNKLDIMTNIQQVEDEMNIIKKDKNNKWNYFDDLLYPFKLTKKINKNIKEVEITDFTKIKKEDNYIISLLPYQYISSKKFAIINNSKSNQKKFGDENYPIEDNAITILEIFLIKYYKHIKTVNELSIIYKDNDTFKLHENIFNIYKSNKF